MSFHAMTDREKLARIEDAIWRARHYLRMGRGDRELVATLCAVAADYRGREPGRAGNVLALLEGIVARGRHRNASDVRLELGNAVAGAWPTIKQALEAFSEELTA